MDNSGGKPVETKGGRQTGRKITHSTNKPLAGTPGRKSKDTKRTVASQVSVLFLSSIYVVAKFINFTQ